MKKVLIFYAAYGGGHLSAARSIKEYLEDNYNDIEMLQCAKYSFAMQHSEEGVKKCANYVAGDNNEGAVVAQIKKFVNI